MTMVMYNKHPELARHGKIIARVIAERDYVVLGWRVAPGDTLCCLSPNLDDCEDASGEWRILAGFHVSRGARRIKALRKWGYPDVYAAAAAMDEWCESGRQSPQIPAQEGLYTAKDIQILSDIDARRKFIYQELIENTGRGTCMSPEGCRLLVETCLLVGEDWERVRRRYVDGDRSVQVSSEFKSAYAEMTKAARYK